MLADKIDINMFINKDNCSQIINKDVYNICYDYKNKGAKIVSYSIYGDLVNKGNVEERPKFYTESNLPNSKRSKSDDYTNTGYDRGHLAPDAHFDYDQKTLLKTYSMANIVPQTPSLNRKVWIKAEKYERVVASKLGELDVINLVSYNSNKKINNDISIPDRFYKVLYNEKESFYRCFQFENIDYDIEKDKLKNHEIPCDSFFKRG
jgi:endonuclease G, mitochondrial